LNRYRKKDFCKFTQGCTFAHGRHELRSELLCLYPSNNKEDNLCAANGLLYVLDTFTALVTHIAHGEEGKPDINPTYPESSNSEIASQSSPTVERQVECGWFVLTSTVSTHQAPRFLKHRTHSYQNGNTNVCYVMGCCLPHKPAVSRGHCAWATDRQVGLFQNAPRGDVLSSVSSTAQTTVICCFVDLAHDVADSDTSLGELGA
jgi:hypothetical protein